MRKPLVSVIIPTYNYAEFICEAINSVLKQNFPQHLIEIIIVDDGSIDDTSDKIKSYGNAVKYFYQENIGKAWATKIGIENAQGKYIFNLDADDLFLPDKLHNVVNIFEQNKDIVHVSHPAFCWNVKTNTKTVEPIPSSIIGRKILGRKFLSFLYRRNILFGGGSTFAARTPILKDLFISKEIDMMTDEYLVLSTLNQGYSFFLKEPLSVWRIHGNNYSNTNPNDGYEGLMKNIKSMEAILTILSNNDFEDSLKKLYKFKITIAKLAMQEKVGNKSFDDIVNMWVELMRNAKIFGPNIVNIMKCYTVLNRTIPTRVLNVCKMAKRFLP